MATITHKNSSRGITCFGRRICGSGEENENGDALWAAFIQERKVGRGGNVRSETQQR